MDIIKDITTDLHHLDNKTLGKIYRYVRSKISGQDNWPKNTAEIEAPTQPPSGTGEGVEKEKAYLTAINMLERKVKLIQADYKTLQAELTRLKAVGDKMPMTYQIIAELQKTDARPFSHRETGLLGNFYGLVLDKLKQALKGGEGGK